MTAITESAVQAHLRGGRDAWAEITLSATRTTAFSYAGAWRPAVNAYRCGQRFVIFVDMAGVAPEGIHVAVQPRRISLHGERQLPEPVCPEGGRARLLALEIDHGRFERVLDLPEEIRPDDMTTEYRDGLLRIELPLRG
jgi:HSP20 family protein